MASQTIRLVTRKIGHENLKVIAHTIKGLELWHGNIKKASSQHNIIMANFEAYYGGGGGGGGSKFNSVMRKVGRRSTCI